MIEVVRPGAATTVQDLGRSGSASLGVPRGGAFDPWAARAANRLVGNADDAALLELTLAGPTLRFGAASAIALVGDDFELRVDGAPRLGDESVEVTPGTTIEVGRARSGVRGWLAVAGGIDVPLVLGSRATELAAGFGGHEGRVLRARDLLSVFPSVKAFAVRRFESKSGRTSSEGGAELLRLLAGPDEVAAGASALDALVARTWRVSARSDRRGVRLDGEPLAITGAGGSAPAHGQMRSIPMLPGAIELTPSGEPIALGVDAPVTGGYPWVAQIVEADVARLAHLAPGAVVRFARASFEEAESALALRQRELDEGVATS